MPATGADAMVIDLEDATPPDAKEAGRTELRSAVADLHGQIPIFARINDASTPWHHDDLDSLPDGLDAIVVPKLETIGRLDALQRGLEAR